MFTADHQKKFTDFITGKGRAVILRRVTSEGSFNTTTGKWEGRTVEDVATTAIDAGRKETFAAGSLVTEAETTFILPAGVTVTTSHLLVDDGDEHDITEVIPVRPGDLTAVQKIKVAK